jgi:hypothetical protein
MNASNIHIQAPARGKVAINSRKEVGLITSDRAELSDYLCADDGVQQDIQSAWRGIHLSPSRFGWLWTSRDPIVLNGASLLMKQVLDRLAYLAKLRERHSK